MAFEQQIGLNTTISIRNHILRTYKKAKSRPPKSKEQTKLGPLLLYSTTYVSTDSCLYGTPDTTAAAHAAVTNTNIPVIDVAVQ